MEQDDRYDDMNSQTWCWELSEALYNSFASMSCSQALFLPGKNDEPDVLQALADGFVTIHDRIKEMIKVFFFSV